jgi:hypothetical protein
MFVQGMGYLLRLFSDHPYLWSSLFLVLVFFFPLYLAQPRDLRISMLKMGTLNAAFFPFCALLEGSYWQPTRLGGWLLGPEDVVISFALGAVVWGLAVWPLRHRIRLQTSTCAILRRMSRTLVFLVLFLGLRFLGLSWMTSYLVTLLSVAAVGLLLLPSMRPLAFYGAIVFVPLYFLYVTLILVLWPEALIQWNPAPPWGARLLGIPAGELAWSLLFGAALPLIGAYVLDARLIDD